MSMLSIAVLACLASSGAQAQTASAAQPPVSSDALPADLPPYGQEQPLPPLNLVQQRLSNGLTVWVLPRSEGLPKVNYVLAVPGGLAHDPEARPGMSNLLAELLSEGTATRNSTQIAEELASLGASLTASANSDGMLVSASGLSSSARPLAAVFADVARNPAFPEDEVELAKANALQALKANEAQPRYQANKAMAQVLYGDHPYGNMLPTEASIAGTDIAGLKAAHQARFRPDQALLVVAGRVTADEGLALAQSAFGDWNGAGPTLPPLASPGTQSSPQFVLVPRADSVQSELVIGRPAFAAGDERAVAAELTSTILGGGFDSRLMRNLREEKGYTYGAGSNFILRREGGAFAAGAAVRNEVTGAAVGEFLKEFERMRTEPLTNDELARAKRYTAGLYLFQNQMQGAVASQLARNWLLGRPADYLGTYVEKARRLTSAQVQDVAREFFDPKAQSIVVVGDPAVAAQLSAYGNFGAK